jgi:hypothetical protein
MDLYIHSPIRLHGVVLNKLIIWTTLPFTFLGRCRGNWFTEDAEMGLTPSGDTG